MGKLGNLSELSVGLVSISDRASSNVYEDLGIPCLKNWLERAVISPFRTAESLIPDDKSLIQDTLIRLVDEEKCHLVLTTGGTGPAPRDVTPDATLEIGEKLLPGFGEQMIATANPLVQQKDMKELLSIIVKETPEPGGDVSGPFRMQISAVDYSPYLGKIGIGKISRGVLALRDNLVSLEGEDGPRKQLTVSSIQIFKGLDRVNVDRAEAGQIVIINGIEDIKIGATLCDSNSPEPFPILQVDEPTLGVNFFVNSSPFAGREGKFVTGRQIRERLKKELITNLALKVNFNDDQEIFEVFGRGELHLTILIENLRREGFELSVSKPKVVYKTDSDGKRLEPYETLIMEVETEFQGVVMKILGERGAKLCNMENINEHRVRLEYFVSTKSLIGFHGEFTALTKGTGIFSHSFAKYDSVSPTSSQRKNGALVSQENGTINAYALWKIQERGRLFVSPGVEVYEGMIIGIHARPNDLVVNPIKGKKLTNIRASGKDEHIELKNMLDLNLEKGLGILGDDELLEITPKALRIRKVCLTEGERRRNSREVTSN
mgnify:CR=1 FL=1